MTDLPAVIRWRLSARVVWMSIAIGLFCAVMRAGQVAKEPFEVGQRWEYRHEGPRPGSMEPNAIDGERIMHVIAVVEKPEGKQWIIEERFTKGENVVGRLHVNEERLLTAIEIENAKGEAATLRYDPPVPHQVTELTVGEEKILETSLKMDSAKFTLPSTIVIRRLDNETITTPAGEFVDCRHYKTTTKSIFNIKIAKIPFTEERERWYHPKVNGLVKEVYRKGPVKFLAWSQKGYMATSVLTASGEEDVPVGIRAARRIHDENPGKEPPGVRRLRLIRRAATHVILPGAIAVIAAGIFVLKTRTKRKRDAHREAPTQSTMRI